MTPVRDIDRNPPREAMVAGLVQRGGEREPLRDLRVPPAQGHPSGRATAVAA